MQVWNEAIKMLQFPQLVNNGGCELLIKCLMMKRLIAVMFVNSVITLHPLDYEIS